MSAVIQMVPAIQWSNILCTTTEFSRYLYTACISNLKLYFVHSSKHGKATHAVDT